MGGDGKAINKGAIRIITDLINPTKPTHPTTFLTRGKVNIDHVFVRCVVVENELFVARFDCAGGETTISRDKTWWDLDNGMGK